MNLKSEQMSVATSIIHTLAHQPLVFVVRFHETLIHILTHHVTIEYFAAKLNHLSSASPHRLCPAVVKPKKLETSKEYHQVAKELLSTNTFYLHNLSEII